MKIRIDLLAYLNGEQMIVKALELTDVKDGERYVIHADEVFKKLVADKLRQRAKKKIEKFFV